MQVKGVGSRVPQGSGSSVFLCGRQVGLFCLTRCGVDQLAVVLRKKLPPWKQGDNDYKGQPAIEVFGLSRCISRTACALDERFHGLSMRAVPPGKEDR